MSEQKIKAPRGTFDILGDDSNARLYVESHARSILERAGFERIETPTFEATELFARGVGGSTDVVQKQMYSFDDGSGRSLTLRPEGTASVCRAFIEHGMHKRPAPVKLWYFSPFYRYESPQAGRYRQFWQVGAETIGSDDPLVDAESILLLAELFEAVGVRDFRVRLSTLGTPETRSDYREELQRYLRANEDSLSEEVRNRIDLNPLRAFDSDHSATKAVMVKAPRLMDWLSDDDRDHFAAVRALLEDAALQYEVDPTLVRGLDYYTRTLFEFTSDALGAQSGVAGGGRYDRLIEMIGGPATPAIGWSAGVERLILASEQEFPTSGQPDLFVAFATPEHRASAFRISTEMRRAGYAVRVELSGRSLKAQLKQADKAGVRYVAICGDEGISLKNMDSGEQIPVKSDELMQRIGLPGGLPDILGKVYSSPE